MSRRKIHLSYSAISLFKRCPTGFMAKYIAGLRRTDRTESQGRGINWHSLMEIARCKVDDDCPICEGMPETVIAECAACAGTGLIDGPMDAAIRVLDHAYAGETKGRTVEEIQTERAKLLYCLSGYQWFWGEDEYEVIATEVPFELSLLNPETGNPCRDAVIKGVIDKIVRKPDGIVAQFEHKSTGRPIGADSTYWNHLVMDTQTTLYPYAMLRLQKEGQLEKYSITPDDPISMEIVYDVWHVPGIKMKKLSQADTKKLVADGEYCGVEFEVTSHTDGGSEQIVVDGEAATVVEGKGGISIVETEAMYGARLLQEIQECPEKYFARREIKRSMDELARFEGQLYSIYQSILFARKTGYWLTCEHECENNFRCEYTSYCWHGEPIEPDNILEGFENMFIGDDDE